MAECGAKTRSGTPCRMAAMPNGRCKLHGGKSLGGMAAPALKHGRYSKYLPERMLDHYHQAAEDATLLELRADIALVDTRLADVLRRVDTGESGKLWTRAAETFENFRGAGQNVEQARLALEQLGELLRRGQGDWAAWEEVSRLLEQRRRMVESERRYLVEQNQMISRDQAMLLIGALTTVIREHVTDRDTLTAISSDFNRLLNRGSSAPAIDGPHPDEEV